MYVWSVRIVRRIERFPYSFLLHLTVFVQNRLRQIVHAPLRFVATTRCLLIFNVHVAHCILSSLLLRDPVFVLSTLVTCSSHTARESTNAVCLGVALSPFDLFPRFRYLKTEICLHWSTGSCPFGGEFFFRHSIVSANCNFVRTSYIDCKSFSSPKLWNEIHQQWERGTNNHRV